MKTLTVVSLLYFIFSCSLLFAQEKGKGIYYADPSDTPSITIIDYLDIIPASTDSDIEKNKKYLKLNSKLIPCNWKEILKNIQWKYLSQRIQP